MLHYNRPKSVIKNEKFVAQNLFDFLALFLDYVPVPHFNDFPFPEVFEKAVVANTLKVAAGKNPVLKWFVVLRLAPNVLSDSFLRKRVVDAIS